MYQMLLPVFCCRAVSDRKSKLPSAQVVLTGQGKAAPVYTDSALIDFKVSLPLD